MVEIPQSSFIPKEGHSAIPGRVRRNRTFHVFGFLATVTLVGSIILAGVVFFLSRNAGGNLVEAQQALQEQESLFSPEKIAEVREFDRRLQAATLLIGNHISPLKIFAALEKYTKQKVQFTSFSLEHTPTLESIVSVEGSTSEYKILALQESGFEADTLLRNVILDQVTAKDSAEETKGPLQSISFSLKGVIDPSLILYDGQTSIESSPVTYREEPDGQIAVDESVNEGAVLGESIIVTDPL